MNLRALLPLTLTLTLLTSCAGLHDAGPAHLAPAEHTEWSRVLAENTRRSEPYTWAMREADLRATLVTPRLRKAFLDAKSGFEGRFVDEAVRELVALGNADEGVDAALKSHPDSEEQVVLFIAMYVADQKDRDLAASYTIWNTRLVRGEASAKPIKLETVRNSPAVADMFPYVDRYDDLYIARFPLVDPKGRPFLSPGGDPLRLEVKSALADAVVEWTLVE